MKLRRRGIGLILGLMIVGGLYVPGSRQALSGELVREWEGDNETVIVGVISDTHIPTRAEAIPPEVFSIFENANSIVHAGDFVELPVARELERIAPVVGVQGNMDPPAVRERYPGVNSLEILGWRIGVFHDGMPMLRSGGLRKLARENGFNVLVYGHTHRGSVEQEGGVLYVNPGSPTQPLFSKASVGVLKVSGDRVEAEVKPLS